MAWEPANRRNSDGKLIPATTPTQRTGPRPPKPHKKQGPGPHGPYVVALLGPSWECTKRRLRLLIFPIPVWCAARLRPSSPQRHVTKAPVFAVFSHLQPEKVISPLPPDPFLTHLLLFLCCLSADAFQPGKATRPLGLGFPRLVQIDSYFGPSDLPP